MKGLKIAVGIVAGVFILTVVIISSVQANGSTNAERIGQLETRVSTLEAGQAKAEKKIAGLETNRSILENKIESFMADFSWWRGLILLALVVLTVLWVINLKMILRLRKRLVLFRGGK